MESRAFETFPLMIRLQQIIDESGSWQYFEILLRNRTISEILPSIDIVAFVINGSVPMDQKEGECFAHHLPFPFERGVPQVSDPADNKFRSCLFSNKFIILKIDLQCSTVFCVQTNIIYNCTSNVAKMIIDLGHSPFKRKGEVVCEALSFFLIH